MRIKRGRKDLLWALDRLESRMDRIPWFILASWLTIALALGGIYFQILQVIGKLS